MSFVTQLAPDWLGFPGASPDALRQLRQQLPPHVPKSYFALLSLTDGGEGPLPVQPFNCYLTNVATMLNEHCEAWHQAWQAQGFFVIGGDGGGELIAIDLRRPRAQPLVAIDMVVGSESAREVASSCEALSALLGIERVG